MCHCVLFCVCCLRALLRAFVAVHLHTQQWRLFCSWFACCLLLWQNDKSLSLNGGVVGGYCRCFLGSSQEWETSSEEEDAEGVAGSSQEPRHRALMKKRRKKAVAPSGPVSGIPGLEPEDIRCPYLDTINRSVCAV